MRSYWLEYAILEDGILKAAQGLTSLEEVFRVVSE